MARRQLECEIYTYGIYSHWDDNETKILPRIEEITNMVAIRPGIEFGMVLKLKGGKGKLLSYRIDHPRMMDNNGHEMPPFEGEYFIDSNEYEFFLGDTVWEPYEQMAGDWLLSTWCEGKLIARKKIRLFLL
ncbi:MAG: DUF3859 domain-containing protein [Breznakibacter sp.]